MCTLYQKEKQQRGPRPMLQVIEEKLQMDLMCQSTQWSGKVFCVKCQPSHQVFPLSLCQMSTHRGFGGLLGGGGGGGLSVLACVPDLLLVVFSADVVCVLCVCVSVCDVCVCVYITNASTY